MMRCPHCHVSLTRDPDRWRCRLCAYSVPILWPRYATALLVLALVVSAGCSSLGNVWQVVGKILDTVNTVRTTVDTLRDAGSSGGSSDAVDAAP